MPTSFEDILLAFEFVASSAPGGNDAILCRRTGKIYYRSDFAGIDEFNDELSDEDADDETYIAIPDKREFGLGKPLVLDFAREFLSDGFHDIRYMFSKRGAYPKFKALLLRRHALDRWHAFEEKATNQALRDWCEVNSIELSD
jgi:hypothetical protein